MTRAKEVHVKTRKSDEAFPSLTFFMLQACRAATHVDAARLFFASPKTNRQQFEPQKESEWLESKSFRELQALQARFTSVHSAVSCVRRGGV
jgi:hypothetical protein